MIPIGRIPHRIAVPALVALFVVCGFISLTLDSATFDETAHLGAGVSYLETGDFRLNPEHPPLVKLIAAAPLGPPSPRWRDYDSPVWRGTPLSDRSAPVAFGRVGVRLRAPERPAREPRPPRPRRTADARPMRDPGLGRAPPAGRLRMGSRAVRAARRSVRTRARGHLSDASRPRAPRDDRSSIGPRIHRDVMARLALDRTHRRGGGLRSAAPRSAQRS